MNGKSRHQLGILGVLAAVTVLGQSGCPLRGRCVPDEVNDYNEAALVPPTGPVKEEIHSDCDKVDWRYVTHFADATATVTVRVGDPFEGHDIEGTVSLYDRDAQLLQQAEVRPNESRYEFKFPVVARAQYFIKMESAKGFGPYTVEVSYERADPCAMCPPCTTCVENQCVPIPCCGKCTPAECDAATNECRKDPCGGPCPDGKICDEAEARCVPASGCKRTSECPDGQKCNTRNGRCYKPKEKVVTTVATPGVKKECEADEDCGDGKACVDGKCIAQAEDGPLPNNKIKGKITTSLDSPDGVVLRIAVPPGHGIKVQDRGSVNGIGNGAFKVTKSGGSRVEAIMLSLKKKSDLGTAKSVTITIQPKQ